jgi:hypothetical protein
MSVRSATPIPSSNAAVRVLAKLPGLDQLDVRAYVCWARPQENLYGLRFDPNDQRRLTVRRWIDQYLEIV